MTQPTYPLTAPGDPRFTLGVTIDVAEVLTRHGYPSLTGMDFVELQQALFRFLYRQDATHAERDAAAL